MDRKTYKTALQSLLDDGHKFLAKIHALTDQVSDAGTVEWNMLYHSSQITGVAVDLMYRALYPLRSSLTDDEPLTDVPMVCITCRKPVVPAYLPDPGAAHQWQHLHSVDADDCLAGSVHNPVKAMVAAGNERIPTHDESHRCTDPLCVCGTRRDGSCPAHDGPFDLAKPATSARLNDA